MRLTLIRKRFIISLLIVLTVAAVAYVRKEILFQQAKRLIRQNLEKSLMCKLSIGEIKSGVFGGLVLEKLEIGFPQVRGFAFDIKVDQALVDYNLREIFFSQQKKDVRSLRLVSPTINFSYSRTPQVLKTAGGASGQRTAVKFPAQDFILVLEEGEVSFGKGEPLVKNIQGKLRVNKGGLFFQDIRASFQGNPASALKVYGQLTDEEGLRLTLNLEHLKINDFDVLSNFSLSLNEQPVIGDKARKIRGTLRTYGSVLDNQPFPEISSSFEIQDTKLRILNLSLGDSYDLRGAVRLGPPFEVDLSLNFYQAELSEFVSRFRTAQGADFSGLVSGLIKITGPLTRPKLEGYLEAKQGHFGDLDFISADINIKGSYPTILITDSQICRENDSFFMEGEIDLSKKELEDSLDVKITPDKGILWQGWDITRSRENEDKVHMSKSIADDLRITFDAFVEEEFMSYPEDGRNELGLEYRIFGDKLLRLRLKKEEGILGFERRIKF